MADEEGSPPQAFVDGEGETTADEAPTTKRRWRRRLVLALVILTAISTFVSSVAVWAHGVLFDTDKWVATVGPLAEDERITDAVAEFTVEELLKAIDLQAVAEEALPDKAKKLALPLTNALQGFLTDQTQQLLRTEQFQKLWVDANRFAHEQVIRILLGEPGAVYAKDGEVTLNLVPLLVRVLDKVQRFGILPDSYDSPDITRQTPPDEAIKKLSTALDRKLPSDFGQIVVFDSDKLAQAQDAVKVVDKIVYGLVLLSVVLAVVSVVLSLNRRRTILQLGVGIVAALVVTGAVVQSFSNYVLGLIDDDADRTAASVVLDQVLHSLRGIERWVLLIGLVLAVSAWLVGDSRSATRVRGLVKPGGVAADAGVQRSVSFVVDHFDGLRILGVVAALVALIWVDVTFSSLLLTFAALVVYELAIAIAARGHTTTDEDAEPPEVDGPASPAPAAAES